MAGDRAQGSELNYFGTIPTNSRSLEAANNDGEEA
jgi:hypothetical protein